MSCFRGNWHLFLLGGAVFLFAAVYMPQLMLSDLSSDTLLGPSFFQDIVEQGHPASEWYWCGPNYIFPDLVLIFILESILHNGIEVLEICLALFYLGWIVLLSLVYMSAGGRRPAVFASGAAVLVLALVTGYGFDPKSYPGAGFNISGFFTCEHGGCMLCIFASWLLILRYWRQGHWLVLVLLGAVTLLASASDPLYVISFVGPACISLVATAYFHRAQAARALIGAGVIGVCCALGYWGVTHVFPPQSTTGRYTQLNFTTAFDSFESIGGGFDGFHPLWVILIFLDLSAVVLCAVHLVFNYKHLSSLSFLILLFSALVVLINWGAAILTGNFTGLETKRYVMMALFLPWVLLLVFVAEVIPWNQPGTQVLAVMAATITVICALQPPFGGGAFLVAKQLTPILRQFKQQGITAGLSEYWNARLFSFLTDEDVPLRQITLDGDIYHNVNTDYWYAGNGKEPPQFRFILTNNLDEHSLLNRYGPPMRIMRVRGIGEFWIYSPEDAIWYNSIFRALGNRHTFPRSNSISFPGAALPSPIGHIEGNSRVARSGSEPAGCLTCGTPVNLKPGRYAIEFHYTYGSAPAPGKAATYDAIIYNAQLDQGILPYRRSGPDVLTSTVSLPADLHHDFEFQARTFYHGSCDFKLDSLVINYTGPPATAERGGGALPSQLGHIEGSSRVAEAAKDAEGCLTFGPYLHLKPGMYRIEFHYAYNSPPATDKAVTYDAVLDPDNNRLGMGTLPFHKLGPDALTSIISLSPDMDHDNSTLEARTFYHASGNFQLDSLVINDIGPPVTALYQGAALPSQSGQVEGLSRVAHAAKDKDGCLTFGPYLHLNPGTYSLEFHYGYNTPPAAEKAVTYDAVINFGKDRLDQGTLPYHRPGSDVLTTTISLSPDSDHDDSTLEARTFYHASGDFRLDYLVINYAGPTSR